MQSNVRSISTNLPSTMNNECEDVIAKTGWGLCHYFIVALCCMCTFVEACSIVIILIVAALLTCDLNLNASQTSALNATSSFGMAVGAILFGIITDAKGRKRSIPITMVIAFCASISLSFAQNSFLINLSIFVLGLGLAGNNVVLRVYLIECLPVKRRGTCLVILDLLWIAGYLSALGVSWSLIPSAIQMQTKAFRPNSWRVLAGLGGIPHLILACLISVLPPSPRYLLYRQRHQEALSVLQEIYAINSSKHAETYPASNMENCVRPFQEDRDGFGNVIRRMKKFCSKAFKRIMELFEAPFKRTTLLGMFICLVHFPGFVWLALWNTSLLQEMHKERIDIKLLTSNTACVVNMENITLGFLHGCEQVNADRFEYLLLLPLSYILGEIALLIGIDRIGRKAFLISSSIIGAVASFALIFTSDESLQIALSSIFLASYAIGRTTTTTLLLENYPTGLRGTMLGLTRILPYKLASFIKLSLNIRCLQSVIIVSGLFLSAAFAGLPLRDLSRVPMYE